QRHGQADGGGRGGQQGGDSEKAERGGEREDLGHTEDDCEDYPDDPFIHAPPPISNNGPRGAIVPPTTVIPEMLLWQRRGRSKSASGPPFLPGELPETPPVVPFERPVGARDDDGVTAERVAVEPGGLVGAGVDAAVAAVPAALGPLVVLGVHVLAAVGDADGVVDHHVVVAGVALGPAGRDHADRVALVHGQVDAAGGGVFAGGGHARA